MAKELKTKDNKKETSNLSLHDFIINEVLKLNPQTKELGTGERLNALIKILPYIIPKETKPTANDQREDKQFT